MDVAPSMVQRSGDKLIVRRVVSGERVHLGEPDEPISTLHHQQQVLLEPGWRQTFEDTFGAVGGPSASPPPTQHPDAINEMDREDQQQQQQPVTATATATARDVSQQDEQHLPQCKIKRNYSCGRCTYFTQNPRKYLTHLRDTHGEKIVINECKRCLYASRHYQKLVRHMKMVHGSVDGIKKSGSSFPSTSSSSASSSFGHGAGRRNRIQRATGYLGANEVLHHHHPHHHGGSSSGSPSGNARFLMRANDADRELATAYVQQLVAASGLPKLLEEMERSVAGTSIAASKAFALRGGGGSSDAEELHQLNQIMPYSSETIREAARRRTTTTDDNDVGDDGNDDEDDDGDGDEDDGRLDNAVSTEEEEADTKPKKRPRPIPNLIPLSASSSPATSAAKATDNLGSRRFVKPLPLSALTTAAEEPVAVASGGTQIVPTRCVYCELSFKTVESLANHIKLAHKEDLIAALLQSSFEETEPTVRTSPADGNSTPTVNMWQRLLDCSAEVRRAELERSSSSSSTTSTNRTTDQSGRSRAVSAVTVEEGLDDDDGGREGDEHQQHHQQHQQQQPHTQQTYCGVETAPGYGEVISRVPVDPGTSNTLMKKVFKCPHCSFWASTASRFHVHIVGHLNKKPFECSLCAYRSNWRWDITKHIRLKTIRDPSHKNAGVLMNDETGRRNYTKYNKYMALMQITDK